MTDPSYPGGELELFAEAVRWKSYLAAIIRPFLGPRVLEVGAGLGGTTAVLCRGGHEAWTCLEPDPELLREIESRIATGELPGCCRASSATVGELDRDLRFDTILYIDVLEHIEDDRAEAHAASLLLEPGGHLVILSPAHQWLFTPFDQAIGHFRRYTRSSLRAAVPADLERVRLRYIDAVGLLASAANRVLLRQKMPTRKQILFWDRVMVPVSRVIDPLALHRIGKSVIGIWKRRRARA